MQGIPGSGKSHIAKALEGHYHNWGETAVLSTDNYWWKDGIYRFNAELLPDAHQWNQDHCRGHMLIGTPTIIIDNTNITRSAARPYLSMAAKYDYQVQVVRVTCSVDLAIERNAQRSEDRQVPEEVIRKMASEMEELL
jgi:NEDD4-binding protein 2